VVRREEAICRTHERAVHYLPGVSPGVIAAVTVAEHGPLDPGFVARELRRWEQMARRGTVYRPASHPCGEEQCCGPGPRGFLEEAIRHLPARARPGLRRMISRADQVYLSHTLPDPLADPQAPWWERRRPIGWPRSG
jgi:hypothetical protein